ncbi:MAG: DNA-directed RNA polymerase subunit omega [Calditrichaeota bacterium]|nr:DNA-directed RNA polymerase subunit omega [Calditrichota bacterium]
MEDTENTKEILQSVEGDQPEDNQLDENQDDEQDLDESSSQDEEAIKQEADSEKRLPWFVNDFKGITESVYEAASIASARSRQIGRQQKQEIDNWFTAHDITEGAEEVEEESEPGVDHFHHCKPTVKALRELTNQELKHRYLEKKKK